ncbi:hypothetical protein F5Y05DRAFT_296185 [Hypoxylon sp. FL0543]|nr:hypothetical protein F5Y05DRAFT_296185 [Hypoxylon sp. FL0543]
MSALIMASPTLDHRASRPPFVPTQPSRGHELRSTHRIIVEPTPENQKIYNEIRQTHERLQLQTHVASQQNLLPPPSAPSVSTVHSPTDELETPTTLDIATQDTEPPRRQRGRRRGPLEATTRLHTALKRKLKLACPHHRIKKTTCDCHDFSKLEEGYHSSPLPRPSSRGGSHDQAEFPSLTPIERTLNSETFGAVGGAITPSDQEDTSNELINLQPSVEDSQSVRSRVRQILTGFDANSVHLDREMLQARGQTYHPGNDIGAQSPRGYTSDEFLEIGSQMLIWSNRWHCGYKSSPETASETSSEHCSWSGPFKDLSRHYRTEHHPFYDASPRFWFVCRGCNAKVKAPDDAESPLTRIRCGRERCQGPWEKWYYGSTREESIAGSAIGLTQSDESEAGFSWNLQQDGNQSWLNGGGSTGGYNRYAGAGSSYERSHHTKWDTSSDSSGELSDCGRCPLEYFCSPRKDYPRCHPLDPVMRASHSGTQSKYSTHQCPSRLLPFAKLPIRHFLSIIPPLLTTIIRENIHLTSPDSLLSNSVNADAISWWSLLLLSIGFLATWALKDGAKSRAADELRYRDRGHQSPRNRNPLLRIRHDVVATI